MKRGREKGGKCSVVKPKLLVSVPATEPDTHTACRCLLTLLLAEKVVFHDFFI
jgi:hypothetical protein